MGTEMKILLGVVVILLLIGISRANYELYDDMLSGMWVSDPEWAARADLDGMLLYVGPSVSWFGEKRRCYLIMYADNRVVVSKQIQMNISLISTLIPVKTHYCSVDVEDLEDGETFEGITDDDTPFEDIMPRSLTLELGVSSGKLVIKGYEDGEETEFARLYKDAAATDIARSRSDI